MGARQTNLAQLAGSGLLSGVAAPLRTLPVLPAFGELLPGAVIQRGSVVGCQGSSAVSLALALAAGPSLAGAWVGVTGLPSLGVAAAVELGVAPERLVMVAEPAQRFGDAQWADVLAAMIDGFDVLLLGPDAFGVRAGTARRLVARVQSRGAVLLTVAGAGAGAAPSPLGADQQLDSADAVWQGPGPGPSHLDIDAVHADGTVEPASSVTAARPVPSLRRTG